MYDEPITNIKIACHILKLAAYCYGTDKDCVNCPDCTCFSDKQLKQSVSLLTDKSISKSEF